MVNKYLYQSTDHDVNAQMNIFYLKAEEKKIGTCDKCSFIADVGWLGTDMSRLITQYTTRILIIYMSYVWI